MPARPSPMLGPWARIIRSRRSTTRRPSAHCSRRTIPRPREETTMNLQDKRVLITGGSSGIGLAVARALLAKGAKVVITGRRPDVLAASVSELKTGQVFVSGVAADVGTIEGRALTLKQAVDALGGLDILVNNAGGVRAGRLGKTAEAEI